ncbi:MAG: hypothetical protein SFV81_07290 [Pirellulaceae bacterium]|nr:hypothetical protein [Pirellulaceae bacterium]
MFTTQMLATFFAICLASQNAEQVSNGQASDEQASDEQASMPSLNYWNISLEILKNPQFATDLGVSKQQRDQIRTMRSSERFLKIFSGVSKKNSELEDAEIWLMLDVEVKQALGEILTADQLRDCRAKLLRQRLPTVRAFFSDGEVLAYLGLDDQSRRSLEKNIAQLTSAQDETVTLSVNQAFIFIMVTNPKPNNRIPILNSKRAVSNSNSHRAVGPDLL